MECLIEFLPTSSRAPYEDGGLTFSTTPTNKNRLTVIQSALSLISAVPTMHTTVSQYLRSFHVLESAGIDEDVSHSDPEVPFSIFASVPPANRAGRVRLAESIVHECMHLQLTLVERVLTLARVRVPEARFFSPWRQTLRPVSGVLHGFYVFAVVHEFFRALSRTASLTSEESVFVRRRRSQIREELAQVALRSFADELTADGRLLVRCLNRCLGFPARHIAQQIASPSR